MRSFGLLVLVAVQSAVAAFSNRLYARAVRPVVPEHKSSTSQAK